MQASERTCECGTVYTVYKYVNLFGANSKNGSGGSSMAKGAFRRMLKALNRFAVHFPPVDGALMMPNAYDLEAERARRCDTVEKQVAFDEVLDSWRAHNPHMSGVSPPVSPVTPPKKEGK